MGNSSTDWLGCAAEFTKFCESPEERPLSCCGVEACEKGRAQEDFPLRSFQLPIESTKGNNSSTKGNQVKRQ